jgi:ATP-dependent 26S proteasome regulatory subunit
LKFEENLLLYIQAHARLIQVATSEIQRIQGAVNYVATQIGVEWFYWNCVGGLKKWNAEDKKFEAVSDERNASSLLESLEENYTSGIFILEDLLLEGCSSGSCDARLIQRLKNFSRLSAPKTLVVTQSVRFLPKELEKEISVLDMELPSKADLRVILENVCEELKVLAPVENSDEENLILESALGLTIMESELAFRKAIQIHKEISAECVSEIVSEKESIIRKSGFLEYYHPNEDMKSVGGLDVLKNWLQKRGKAFGLGAKDFGLDTPRGVLLLGIPGTGKSLSAKAIANTWKFPLLRLDIGKVYAGIVGASEENIRGALKLAEAIAPCVLWIDEIEKGLSGVQSSGSTDGGTSSRVLGTFLTWMQEKKKPVFVVATANDVSQLPPELLRKGRMDEIFFVDLPTQKARKEILSICLSKKQRKPEKFDLDQLVEASKGFSGAELEEAVKEGLFTAFDAGEELTNEHIRSAIKRTFPLSRTMGDTIKSLRQWAKAKAVNASSEESEEIDMKASESVPKLKQEAANPFIK